MEAIADTPTTRGAGQAPTGRSTRFHPHLVAAAIGASGLTLAGRSDYYPTKHRSLIEAGSNWHMLNAADLPETPVRDGGFTVEAVSMNRRIKRALAARIYPTAPTTAGARIRRAGRILWSGA
ncbi:MULTISPECIES: hypothetical protein [unclassified Rhodococcus (in: high G+C Gram-positive bacteria)]|uniref:hypothetical protein n=1 Tax=unclassified Rhodococcus (in: high G+C Gram-positive bacteria) TaxID=192944 RepID=UPI0002A272BF|nr:MULTISPECIES: hypothetical protein [unclassified Rhodococcus (in: high G+C Gram-positive bacteria)]ELB94115.1 hypothetical protein Rwratislav_05560 [Rhodococcus wratislaviensis IFP 2016]MBC2645023.1 hypothetical protein [Rhodococcus sp. 3A]MBC2898096.1 hypothetical protein [Rhodococcus sp. 4CII]